MSIIKRLGVPNRNLKASIGDIYIDLKTGNKYQCTFSYVVGNSYECDWKLVEANTKVEVEPKIEKAAPVVEEVIVEEASVINDITEVVEAVEEKPVEEISEQPAQPKRTDYASYSKNKKRK